VAAGCEARVLLPGFPAVLRGLGETQAVGGAGKLPEGVQLRLGLLAGGVPAYVIDAPEAYQREGNPYAGADGHPYGDNHRRFALLARTGALMAQGLDPMWSPEVVHSHDWHAALTPAYLHAAAAQHGRRLAGSVYTVHNLAYQGVFGGHLFGELGLPGHYWGVDGVEFHGQLSFMKAGLQFADRISTVSPTYAREIQGPEQGCGLDGLLRHRTADLVGILNGVDEAIWNPAADALIAARYEARRLAPKQACREALQREFGLEAQTASPVFGVVSRLTEQKGFNLVMAGLPELLRRGGQLVVLGSGDAALEAELRHAAGAAPRQVAVHIGYDEPLAHRVVAGADVIMVPSRFEPCGLTQLYGLKYGTLPLVRRVGGLADTVVDCALEHLDDDSATGVVFDHFDSDDFVTAVRRAIALFRRPDDWHRVQRRAMAQRFDWSAAADQYLALYRQVRPG
jgi:starch synthase